MSIDERHRREWSEKRARRELVRNVQHLLHTFGQREGEDDDAYERRLRRADDLFAVEMDLREDVANEDDATPKD